MGDRDQNHEGLAGLTAAVDYLAGLASVSGTGRRDRLAAAYEAIDAHERLLADRFLVGLASLPSVRLWGIADRDRIGERTPTFAIRVGDEHPAETAKALGARGIFVWDGDYYAREIMVRLGLFESGGAVRIGFCHYHSPDEVDRVLDALRSSASDVGDAIAGGRCAEGSETGRGAAARRGRDRVRGHPAPAPLRGTGGAEQSYDTPYYVWRTRAVASDGLGVLTTIPTGAVPERPGVPVLGATLGDVIGSDALTYTVICARSRRSRSASQQVRWPSRLSESSMGVRGVRRRRRRVRRGRGDGGRQPRPTAGRGPPRRRRGGRPTGGGGTSRRGGRGRPLRCRGGDPLGVRGPVPPPAGGGRARARADHLRPPVRRGMGDDAVDRLLRVVLVASAAAVATLVLLPTLPDRLPPAIGDRGNQLRLAAYELSLVLPLAALGFVLTFPRSEGSRRTTLLLLGLWAATVPFAIALSAFLPTPISSSGWLRSRSACRAGHPRPGDGRGPRRLPLRPRRDGRRRRGARRGTHLGERVTGVLVRRIEAESIAERMAQARTAGRYLDGILDRADP